MVPLTQCTWAQNPQVRPSPSKAWAGKTLMAAAQAANGQNRTRTGAMKLDGFDGILRAGGIKPAPGRGSEEQPLGRRKGPAVKLNRKDDQPLDHGLAFNKPCWRSALRKSRSTSEYDLRAMEFLATRTRSTGRSISCWCRRKTSRRSLLARFRTVAGPTFLLETTPKRSPLAAFLAETQLRIKDPQASRWPSSRARANWPGARRRRCAGSVWRAGPAADIQTIKPG